MVSKEIQAKLEKYSPRLGKTSEELEVEYAEFYERAKDNYPDLKGKKLDSKALDLLVNSYRRKHGDVRYSGAEMFEGWIDGASHLRNQVDDKIRNITFRVQREGREACILQELIDENGVPIDDRPNIFGRRKNPNYRKPLVQAPPAYIRTLYGMARKKGETAFAPFQMTFFEDAAEQITYRTNRACEFRASAGKQSGKMFGSDTTKFFPIDADWDMEDIYDNTPNAVIPCEELEVRMVSTNWDDRDIRVKVDVINVNPNPLNDRGDKVMGVGDMSIPINESISCFVPAHVKMDFGQDSKVVIAARARKYKEKPSLNVYGIWPIPGHITYANVDELEEEDIVDVGWQEPDSDFQLDETASDLI